MNINRRYFCSALAVGSATGIPQTASAQSEIQITGSITSSVGATVGGVELFFQQVDSDSFWRYTIPESGDIDLTVSETGTYRVRLFNTKNRNEDIPLVYSFGEQPITMEENNLNLTIPKSYNTKIRCVNTNGEPLEGLSVTLRAGGTNPGTQFTTSEQGFVTFLDAKQTAIQLAGSTEVEVESPSNSARQRLGTVDVTESSEFELTVENPDKYDLPYEIIEADPEAGFYYPYLLYRPNVSENAERPLYVEPNNTRAVEDHEGLIEKLRSRSLPVASRNESPGIVAGFPRTPNDGPDHIQSLALPSYRSELLPRSYQLEDIATEEFSEESLTRIDEQLIAMIEDAKTRLASEPYSVADQIHMNGFSSSATFSNRFAFLYPDKVRTLTAGGSVLLPLPKASHNGVSLPYPLGTADYEELTGKEFDKEQWASINRYIYLGQEDQPLPSTDSRGYYPGTLRYEDKVETVYDLNRVTDRFPLIKSVYTSTSNNAKFEIFEGIGHEITQDTEDAIVEFHRQNSPTPNPDQITRESEAGSKNNTSANRSTTVAEQSEQGDRSDGTSDDAAPGFGIASGIIGLGAAGYMIKQLLADDSE